MKEQTNITDQQIADEAFADKLIEEGLYSQAAEFYSKCLKPFAGYNHLKRIAEKQTNCWKRMWGGK